MPADGSSPSELKPGQSGLPYEPRPYDEVHHAHGHAHPKARHHWYWYGGCLVFALGLLISPLLWWQFDRSAAPLCRKENVRILPSPRGGDEMELATVSCFGGHAQQKLFLRHKDGRLTMSESVASFDLKARVRARWRTDGEIIITQRGGRIWAFQPVWEGVRVRYT